MADIEDILSNLNERYEEITDLIPDMRIFVDDADTSKNEYGENLENIPLGSQIYRLSNGKYVWVGIDGASQNCRNVRRYNSDLTLDGSFAAPTFVMGDNGLVMGVAEQSDGKLIIVGHFDEVGGESYGKIVRLNTDGSVDASFNSGGSGFNNNALVVKVLSDDSVLVGGTFNEYNGTNTDRLVRLGPNGSLDTSFSDNVSEASGQVHAIHVDPSGKIYIGGEMSNRIARLNSDGTTDTSFDVGSGFNGRVSCVANTASGKIMVGGWFNSYRGASCNPGIVRIEANGSLDSGFTTEGAGLNYTNGIVQSIVIQSDGKVLAGGWFDQYDGSRQGHIIRFNTDGTKDSSFETGSGFGMEDNDEDNNNDWGLRVQSMIIVDGHVLCVGSMESYFGAYLYGFAKLGLDGSIRTERLFRYTTFGIRDGYEDMYDGGNFLNTNLTQPFDDIAEDSVNAEDSIPNTHSAALDENPFEGEDMPSYEPLMDGRVVSGDSYFGSGSKYFTNMYPGMFVMVATGVDIEEFSVTGDLGSDESTQNEYSITVVHEGSTYTVLVKVSREEDGNDNGDPSVNHIIIVPGEPEGLTHLINDEEDYDDDCVRGLTGRNSIVYILVARSVSDYLSYSDAEAIAVKFLEVAGGFSGVQTYNYDFSPQTVRPGYGEGGMDTATVVEDGVHRSLQRTGYFELVDSEGNRKVVAVRDGETVDDSPEAPEATDNPNGHPTFGLGEVPSVSEQFIPAGNPLAH